MTSKAEIQRLTDIASDPKSKFVEVVFARQEIRRLRLRAQEQQYPPCHRYLTLVTE